MNYKLVNKFFVFALAAMVVLNVGVFNSHHASPNIGAHSLIKKLDSFHASNNSSQPFDIEKKEEQPTSEDDESKESSSGDISSRTELITYLQESATLSHYAVVSKSLTEYHTPVYVRLRSILI